MGVAGRHHRGRDPPVRIRTRPGAWLIGASVLAYAGLGATAVRAMLPAQARPLPASLVPLGKLLALHLALAVLSLDIPAWPFLRGGSISRIQLLSLVLMAWIPVLHLAWIRWILPSAVAWSLGDPDATLRRGVTLMRGRTLKTAMAMVLCLVIPLAVTHLGYVGSYFAPAHLDHRLAVGLAALGMPVGVVIAHAVAVIVVTDAVPASDGLAPAAG